MKQIDRFETGLKTATESQKQWRTRVQQRSLELQQAQVSRGSLLCHNAELTSEGIYIAEHCR